MWIMGESTLTHTSLSLTQFFNDKANEQLAVFVTLYIIITDRETILHITCFYYTL